MEAMIIVDDRLISDDILQEEFVCNLDKCKGGCCVDGDAGAPLDKSELKEIKKLIEQYNIPYYLISHILKIDKMTGTKKDTFNIMEKKIKIMEKNIINKKNKKTQ